MYKFPILILTYNRPKKFLRVIESLRSLKPKKIYISCDGPKNSEDIIKISCIRKNILKITWKCKIYQNFFKKIQKDLFFIFLHFNFDVVETFRLLASSSSCFLVGTTS